MAKLTFEMLRGVQPGCEIQVLDKFGVNHIGKFGGIVPPTDKRSKRETYAGIAICTDTYAEVVRYPEVERINVDMRKAVKL